MKEAKKLAELIEQVSGIVIPEGQLPYLEKVAANRAEKAGYGDLLAYVVALEEGGREAEWRQLLPEITIKESYLFRIPEHYRALEEEVLSQLAANRPPTHRLRLWSVGCARGEEPTSLALVLAISPRMAARRWEILASDIDTEALAQARTGEYDERAVAQVPEHLLRRYFHRQGDRYVLDSELRERIEYQTFNLIKDPLPYFDAPFDVIFMRNVLIYFRPESQRRVLARVARRLAPDGYLFLGHSETAWQLCEEMEIIELQNCLAYRLTTRPGARRTPTPSPLPAAPPRTPTPTPLPAAPPPPSRPPPPTPSPQPEAAAGSATDWPLPPPGQELEEAARALAADGLDRARDLVRMRLAADSRDPIAHALEGLIHDLKGNSQRAVAAYRAALFLAPELYQVRFLLAGRLDHLGWSARARNEYRQVLAEIERGRGRELSPHLLGLLPDREEAAERCRRALRRT